MGIEFGVTVFIVVLIFSHIVSWVLVYSLLHDRKQLKGEAERWNRKFRVEKESCDVFRKELGKARHGVEVSVKSVEQWRESYRELDERYGELGMRYDELDADMAELANLSGEYAERVSRIVDRAVEREVS